MIYFKRIEIQNADSNQIEELVRKHCIRRHTLLDLQSSVYQMPDPSKLFLGLEGKKAIQITRLKNTIERILPKMIIRIEKVDFTFYRIRLSLLSSIIAIFLPIALLINLVNSISAKKIQEDLPIICFFNALFFLFCLFEYKKTNKIINNNIALL